MYYQHQTRVLLQQQNDLLRAENRAMIQALASPSICISCLGPIVPTEEGELRLENALLRSELDTLTCFTERLNTCRSLFPAAAASSTWRHVVAAMTSLSLREVFLLARQDSPMWTSSERLNLDEYYSNFFPWFARNAPGFVHGASRASAFIPIDASSLVRILMNPVSWQNIYPSIIADVSMDSRNLGFQMINVEFMPQISPVIQTRNVKLLRRSKFMGNNTWVIADISEYFSSYAPNSRPEFMRFPSGYLVQHISSGISEVTILDHWVYKAEEAINLFNPNSGFGADRWLAALQRHCYKTWLISIPSIGHHIQLFDPICQTNLLNLSAFMVYVFCTGFCGITGQKWKRLGTVGFPVNNIRMFTRETQDMSGVPRVLVSATGLARMQARPEVIFGLINCARKQDIWNSLESVGDMKEVIRIKRCPNPGNEVSVFSFKWTGSKEWYLIQETYLEESGAMIIHACVEAPSFAAVINCGNLSGIELLPCGFTIMPCGLQGCVVSAGCQVKADQAMVTSSDEVVNYLEKMVTDAQQKVQNALSPQS